jgi:parallel beta-helix repeat protein
MPRVIVKRHGAVGNGVVDDTAAIQSAIDQSPLGSTIDFGRGLTYRITKTLTLRMARSYIGSSTIKLDPQTERGTPIAILPYGQDRHVQIEGLTFDASGIGGILLISVGGSTVEPASDLIIRKNVFQNSNPDAASDAQSALYNPVGIRNSEISGNRFIKVGKALSLANLSNTSISHNQFDTVMKGSAINIRYSSTGGSAREPVTVSSNGGKNLSGMAIEIVHASGPLPGVVTVESNRFTEWNPEVSAARTASGIFIGGGSGYRVLKNELTGAGPTGIEVSSLGTLVDGNVITGFDVGITLQRASDSTITNNKVLSARVDGIALTNAAAHKRVKILGNLIENAKRAGISGVPMEYDQIEIADNQIVRAGGYYPDDASVTFYGFQVQPGCVGPSVWRNNTITQTAVTPPAGFRFFGFGAFGPCRGNQYSGNYIESKSSTPLGVGFLLYTAGVLDNEIIEDNAFVSLAHVLDGPSAGSVVARNNVTCNMQDTTLASVGSDGERCRPKLATPLGTRDHRRQGIR